MMLQAAFILAAGVRVRLTILPFTMAIRLVVVTIWLTYPLSKDIRNWTPGDTKNWTPVALNADG